VLGAEYKSTLLAVYDLGLLYKTQGKLIEAEQIYKRALRGYEKVLGAEHKLTLLVVYKLGLLYKTQGKLIKAE
jgi:tetratricopeptide (TPR) repeat protein